MSQPKRSVFRPVACVAATMMVVTSVCWTLRTPPNPIARDDYAVVMALCRACNQRDPGAIETAVEIFAARRPSSPKLLRRMVDRVVAETESDNWSAAETACRDFMRQQVRSL